MIISGVSIPAPVCGYIQTSFHYSGSHAGFQLLFRHFSMVFRPVCNSFFPGLGQGQPPDLRRAPFQEQTGALSHGGAGGHHVVHQQDAQAGQVLPGQPVRPLDVGPPGRLVLQVGLGGSPAAVRASSSAWSKPRFFFRLRLSGVQVTTSTAPVRPSWAH